MFDLPLFSINGALCAAALGVAAFVRSGKREAVTLAGCLLANYLFCALAYTPWAPKLALEATGLDVTSKDLWMLADTAFGVAAILAGFWHWWGTALWACACFQILIHVIYQADLIDEYAYSDRLQNVLHAQLAVFFVIGGPRAWDRLLSCLDRFRVSRRQATSGTSRRCKE